MASLTDQFKYDVFLSFRGEDTRHGFTGYLKKALDDKGIRTFIDDEELQKGNEITPSLLNAIDESMMAIVVLSENYASSSFCLQELSKILDTMKDKVGRSVFPVFYKVDPSDVRKLKKSYGEAMAQHDVASSSSHNMVDKWKDSLYQVANLVGFPYKKHDEASSSSHDMNNKWKDSLHQVASLSGHHYKGDMYEHKFIETIVEQVLKHTKPIIIHVGDYLVGLKHQKQHVTSLLNVGSNDTIHMIGIHGIGGIGKTTLALEVYNSIVNQFQCFCYFEKVRENFDKKGLINLQKILLSQVVGEKNTEITSVREGISILQKRLPQKKVLLLLDDVDNEEQLKAIAGSTDWFGQGSRVIITTRNKRLLTCHGIEKTYEMKGLDDEDAFDLVGWKALKNNYSPRYKDILLEQKYGRELNGNELHRLKILKNDEGLSGYANVLKCAVAYASGLPLALEVIGSHFFKKTIEQCKDALARYERVPHNTIQTTLETSYDALQEEEKVVFLDIACCFQGYELAKVEQILHAHHGDIMKDHITVLVEKSLIKINESGSVTLHDLVEDMGKEIVRRESPNDPGKRSRLWSSKDIIKVLQDNTGTSKIEIIHFDCWTTVVWDGEAFKKMKNLKTLIINDVSFYKNPKHLPNSLRVLECRNLTYSSSNPFEWKGFVKKEFQNIKVLILNSIVGLTQIPDMSGLPNLEEFSIQRCEELIAIDKSVGVLRILKILRVIRCSEIQSVPPLNSASLEMLDLSYCDNLESFPLMVNGFVRELKILRVISCKKIRIIPSLILASLEELNLSNCTGLESFQPVVDGFGDKLKTISVSGCIRLRSIPPLKLDSLETLELSGWRRESFPLVLGGFLGKVKTLLVTSCYNLKSIPPLKLDSLETLDLSHCPSLESFSLVDGFLGKLKTLHVESCHNLRSIPPLKLDSLETLKLLDCNNLKSFPLVVDAFLGKLKSLNVKSCYNLSSIPPLNTDSLETLELSGWHRESFPLVVDGFLGKLKSLLVTSCHNLKSILPLELDSLQTLELSSRLSLPSFPLVVDGFLGKLKTLLVKNCHNLRSLPTRKLDSLEKHDLSDCYMLESFSSVGDGLFDKLKFVNIEFCIMLRSMPQLSLTLLEHFNHSCSYSLEGFPEILGEMRNIPGILLNETPIKELPFPFHNLTQPQTFLPCDSEYGNSEKKDCVELTINEEKMNPMQSSNVKYICFRNFKLLDEYLSKTLMFFVNVKELYLNNNQFTIIPKCIEKCHSLWKLVLDDCKELQEIEVVPPCLKTLSALDCKSLTSSCKSKLLNQELHEARNTMFRLPRVPKIPEWFDQKCEEGLSISFWFRNKFPSIALCVVSPLTSSFAYHGVRVIINGNRFVYTSSLEIDSRSQPDMYHLHLFHMQMENFNDNMDKELLENKWNHTEVNIGVPFQKSGIHVLKEKSNMNDIRFTNPDPENDANIVLHSGY